MLKWFYVDVGVVTNPDAHPGSKIGDTQYRFMDDMDNPTFSYDYVSLEKALAEHSPCVIVWVPKVMRNMRRMMEMNAELPQEQRDMLRLKGMI
jgi:hypothetical protein